MRLNRNPLFVEYFEGKISYTQVMEHYSKIWLDVNWFRCQSCVTLRPETQVQEGKCIYCGELAVIAYDARLYLEKKWQEIARSAKRYQSERQRAEAEQRAFWASIYEKLGQSRFCVYFVKIEGLQETIKIGTTGSLAERLRQLERKYGKIELLAITRGDRIREAEIHQMFASLKTFPNLGRELFLLRKPIMDFIEYSCHKVSYTRKMW